ncbi:hypothetical protein GCM10010174_88650 [Kutzneria viridogrisea]
MSLNRYRVHTTNAPATRPAPTAPVVIGTSAAAAPPITVAGALKAMYRHDNGTLTRGAEN